MSKLKRVVDALILARAPQPENPEDPLDHSKVSYSDVIESLAGAGIGDEEVLGALKELVLAELSFGIALAMGGGPSHPETTLKYEGPLALMKLYREILASLSMLERRHHDEGAEKEPGEASDVPVPGEGRAGPEDPGGDGDAGDPGDGGGEQAAEGGEEEGHPGG